MLDEYALIPDIFDPAAYSNPAFIEMCLPHLKEPLFQEAVVRDLFDGAWSQYCLQHNGSLHRLTKEIVRKLLINNRLSRLPAQRVVLPANGGEWCDESIKGHSASPLSGIIAAFATKQGFPQHEVASIEKLTSTQWWQRRSSSVTIDRKTAEYLKVLNRILKQANSLMFIDPNLDPSSNSYRDFHLLLAPLSQRNPLPKIEIHRSFCRGDGKSRTFPTEGEWKEDFSIIQPYLRSYGLSVDVFFWDDFHDRYLITDVIGMTVPAGFDITGRLDDLTTWSRLGREDKDSFQRRFDPAARPDCLKSRFTIQ